MPIVLVVLICSFVDFWYLKRSKLFDQCHPRAFIYPEIKAA